MKLVQVQKASSFLNAKLRVELSTQKIKWCTDRHFRCQPETTNESELDEEIKRLKAELEEQIQINQICKFNSISGNRHFSEKG